MNHFQKQAITFHNDLRRSCGALVGIIQGMLADGCLNDDEIKFLHDWLVNNEASGTTFPGNVLLPQIQNIVADGTVSPEERAHLTVVLQQIIGGTLEELAESTHVCELAMDDAAGVEFGGRTFCLTGDFVYGPREVCASITESQGGTILKSITKKLNYLVIGGLGSREWKHGSFGTKIEKALQYKEDGIPLLLVHEDVWASSIR